jgi:hypothetical protein
VGRCLHVVDSCSDVTLARRDMLHRLHLHRVSAPVIIAHLEGETILREAGSLRMGMGAPGIGLGLGPVTYRNTTCYMMYDV